MLSGEPLKAILFDVGGPIVDESPDYVRNMQIVAELISEELGEEIDPDEFELARQKAIQSWAPSLTRAVVWSFLKPDRARTNRIMDEAVRRVYSWKHEVNLAEGIEGVIPALAGNYTLALAANQPVDIKEKLERTGLMKYFASTVVSGELKLYKPDSRFFTEICDRIGIPPKNCCMIGDRLDNDIFPANVLGMRTIWIRTGPHALQEPRIPEDVPDAIVHAMVEVLDVIENWEREIDQ